MATHTKEILGWQAKPDVSGAATFEPANLFFGSNDLARPFVLSLGTSISSEPTVKGGVFGCFDVPSNYVSTPLIVVVWSATLTTGTIVFDFDYTAVGGNDAETLDPAAWQESVTWNDEAPTTARRKLDASQSLTGANLAANDLVEFFFGRDGADGTDDLAGMGYVFSLKFQYNDT